MQIKAILTDYQSRAIIFKQVADWFRTISAGAIILGLLNPAITGELALARKALLIIGLPALLVCLTLSIVAYVYELKGKGK